MSQNMMHVDNVCKTRPNQTRCTVLCNSSYKNCENIKHNTLEYFTGFGYIILFTITIIVICNVCN